MNQTRTAPAAQLAADLNMIGTAPQAVDTLTDAQCDTADAVLEVLEAHRDRTYSPSELARAAKLTTAEVREVLPALVCDRYLARHGNGAWTRYTARA